MSGGQQITSGQGSLTPGGAEALSGSESTSEQGSIAPTRLLRLASRKVGGGSASRALVGADSGVLTGTPIAVASRTPTGQSLTSSQGAFGKSREKALIGQLITSSSGTVSNPSQPGTVEADFIPVTHFGLTTTAASGTYPFTIGLGFKKGEVPTNVSCDLTNYQATVKRTWNDGSAKHVILAGRAELIQNQTRTIVVNPGTPPSGTSLTSANITSAAPTASIQCGSIGTITLASLLSSPFRTWISGSQMVECHYRANIGSGNLSGWFFVRLYADNRVWIRAVVENGYLDNGSGSVATNSNQTYTATVVIGGATVFNTSVTHNRNTRWTVEGWINGDPSITPIHNVEYLRETKLVPNYGFLNASAATLNGLTQTYTPMSQGPHTTDMGNTGFQAGIGVLPNWDAMFITTGDSRAYRAVLAGSSSLNSYGICWRDKTTNLAPRPSSFTNWTIYGPNGGGDDGYTAGSLRWEVHHHSQGGYLAYLLTGDYWHLDTLYNEAAMCYFITSQARGSGTNRFLQPGQTRGIAWVLRTVGLFCGIAPEETVSNDYRTLLSNNYTTHKTAIDATGPMIWSGSVFQSVYGNWDTTGTIAPWMTDFWVASNGLIADVEPISNMTNLTTVRDWMYRWAVGRLGVVGNVSEWPFTRAAQYGIEVSTTNSDAGWYPDWPTVYTNTIGGTNNGTGNTLLGGSGADPAEIETGYWGNLLPAIAYAKEHSASGASAAWDRLLGATNYYSNASTGFPNLPVWGIYPRTGRVLQVGPGRSLTTMAAAAAAVREGDTIEIDAGTYSGSSATATFSTNNITIKGVGGQAVMDANGSHAQGKGTWVISGSPVTVENVTHLNAAVPDENGAGIRVEGALLNLKGCIFRDCQNGVQGGGTSGILYMERCEFDHNGFGDGFTHNVYMGDIDLVVAYGCYFHEASVGHNFKSRARANHLEDCFFVDGATGTASYLVDIPDGGRLYMRGCCLHKGVNAQNSASVAYAQESLPSSRRNTITMVHNTLVSTRSGGSFVAAPSGTTSITWTANLFAGNSTSQISGYPLGSVVQSNNVVNTHTNVPNAGNASAPNFTPNSTLLPLAALPSTPDANYLTQSVDPMVFTDVSTSPILAGAVQVASAWVPPYTLPTSGQAIALGLTNRLQDLTATGLSDTDLEYSLNGSFGCGSYTTAYSQGGAYVGSLSGGHIHPELEDFIILDFADRTLKKLANANGAPNNASGWLRSQADLTNGELSGFSQAPVPSHPYFTHQTIPGGNKGRYVQVLKCAAFTDPATLARAHIGDLETGQWTRYSTNLLSAVTNLTYYDAEVSTVYHATANRIYIISREIHNLQHFAYLDLNDATFKVRGIASFPQSGGSTNSSFIDGNNLYIRDSSLGLRRFDLSGTGTIPAGSIVSVTGSLPSAQNLWTKCARDGAWYTYVGSGQAIHRLLFTSATAATVTQVTIGGTTLPTNVRNTNTRHWGRFFAVSTLGNDIFCWWPGGQAQDAYLIKVP